VLREALAEGRSIAVGGVHDGLSALIAERCGYDALWASGLGIAAAHGVPDANILTMTEVRDAAAIIARASRLPVISDCDTGFGPVRNLRRTVAEFEDAGVAAVCIEDKLYPKRNSFLSGQELIDPHEFAMKIRVAKESQRDPAFVVIARLESLIAGRGLEDALDRAALYVDAGADALVVHSRSRTPDEVLEFAREWMGAGCRAPLVAIPTTYHSTTIDELAAGGVTVVIHANQALRAAIRAMEDVSRQILAARSTAPVEEQIAPLGQLFDLTGEGEVERYDQWFAEGAESLRRESVASARGAGTAVG
jgi:phosphoenolpyruvate phosphomutase